MVDGSSLSHVSGTIYDVTVNMISGDGTLRLDLNESGTGIEDAGGNTIAVGYSIGETYSIDNKAPTATISMSKTALYSGETSTLNITFSEAVTGFTNDDLTIPNGILTSVSSADSGITWTAVFTAANVDAATNSIVLDLTGIIDTAGNSGSGTASSGNYTISMPTVPGTPTGVTATAGDTQASVSFLRLLFRTAAGQS
ncbi:MAG: Ig-like domain-containing protein [Eubacteriales bacterium]